MATLAAANVAAVVRGWPAWSGDVVPFLGSDPPCAAPSIVNAAELRLSVVEGASSPSAQVVTSDG